jgi:hypothetical protein
MKVDSPQLQPGRIHARGANGVVRECFPNTATESARISTVSAPHRPDGAEVTPGNRLGFVEGPAEWTLMVFPACLAAPFDSDAHPTTGICGSESEPTDSSGSVARLRSAGLRVRVRAATTRNS